MVDHPYCIHSIILLFVRLPVLVQPHASVCVCKYFFSVHFSLTASKRDKIFATQSFALSYTRYALLIHVLESSGWNFVVIACLLEITLSLM